MSKTPAYIKRGIPALMIASEEAYIPEDQSNSKREGFENAGEEQPSNMSTEPTEKVVFNAPFIDKFKLPLRICNDGSRQVGWAIKTNCPARIGAIPACGVLGPKEKAIFYVTCEPFDYSSTDVSADRITIEWVLTPAGAPKQFKREWFQGDMTTRRKNIPVNYNY